MGKKSVDFKIMSGIFLGIMAVSICVIIYVSLHAKTPQEIQVEKELVKIEKEQIENLVKGDLISAADGWVVSIRSNDRKKKRIECRNLEDIPSRIFLYDRLAEGIRAKALRVVKKGGPEYSTYLHGLNAQ